MRVEVKLPQWGMGMSEGVILGWRKSVGDTVQEGEPLCEVEAAKVTEELEAPVSGTLVEVLVEADTEVEVYTVLAVIETA
ncbi:biotin attachment protein [Nocardioides immobilis]|uniref:Biotin attachment protein n=1 Tax=Nocardioides immobilis TaxID=2049295 RepID=A0A417XWT4_9ACTN|nr:biotin/lipoyl-containing protein [Nocardioides immobilis]RHW24948.1 biotin attachment protein [Nocardioides immobilis]